MKDFRKENEKLICEECHKLFVNINGLAQHINCYHVIEEYFDKWIKEENDGKCKICGKETKRNERILTGYKNCCSIECSNKFKQNRVEEENYKNFGVKNVYQIEKTKKKSKKTKNKKYGNQNYRNDNKIKQTCLKRYGVENPAQNKEIFEKTQKSGFKAKKFKNTNIYYRGNFELDFLEKYYNKYPDIMNALSIKYDYDNKIHTYFPDFYIPSLNLIVEIKYSYYAKRDKLQIIAKEKAAISTGFNYIMIVDKIYTNFIAGRYRE